MAQDVALRPVVDPALDEAERELLGRSGDGLFPATRPLPPEPRLGGRTGPDALVSLTVSAVCAFLPVAVLPSLLGLGAGLAAGLVAQAGLVAVWYAYGFGAFMVTAAGAHVLAWLLIFVFRCGTDERQRLARLRHGRYYLADDFGDDTLRGLLGHVPLRRMERAQAAVTTVLESQVDRAGLLDDIANDVTLPAQQWEIAQRLVELTELAQKVQRAAGDASGSRVEEVLRAQRQALRLSASTLEQRVEALERYAENTRAADAAYREWEAVRELEELGEDMQDLLARTVRDELAVAEIDGLADRSRLQELQRMLGEAREAGLLVARSAEQQTARAGDSGGKA
ncbi:hypothetical protein AB0M28_12090 [Streptomyces sp. NPDC051940]|uniref:hypothetical protein n=1 Tax=Streptomyces sp. NPDC051940 TaxID=3155675 RepID=UPI0034332E34